MSERYNMLKRLSTLCFVLAFSLLAAEPAATITSGPGLKINSKIVPTTGAPTWPVFEGDEIITGSAAVLLFPDQARVTLVGNTRIALKVCDRCIIQLFDGALDYEKPAESKLEFCALGHPIRPAPGTKGSVLIEGKEKVILKVGSEQQVVTSGSCPCKAGAPWQMSSKKKALLFLIPTAAGGAAVGIAVTRPDSSSPSNP